jgi:hypothetical protein
MTSEKALYWSALSVLALAVLNGFANDYRGWAGRVANTSMAVAEQASETGAQYAGRADRNDDSARCVRVRANLARMRSDVARHQVEMVRMQVEGIRAQAIAHEIRAVVDCPEQNFAIQVPDMIQAFEDDSR